MPARTANNRESTPPVCRNCNIELTEENWYPSQQKKKDRICKRCSNERSYASKVRSERRKGVQPFNKNKKCGLFLGVHVAERVLSRVFKDVKRMPILNSGYDFICNSGKRIDVKSSCMRGGGVWSFGIRQNTTADFFLCIAFDNREDLNPLHIWLIPGSTINHLKGLAITESTIHEWDKYRLDISKVAECCDSIRPTNNREITPLVVPKPPPPTNNNSSRLSILSYLKAGLRPVKIAAKMNIAMSTLQYHLTILKKQGTIRKAGYGTWEVLEEPTTEKKTPRGLEYVGLPKPPQPRTIPRDPTQSQLTPHQQDAIRTHAITTTWQVPHLQNWNNEKRSQYLTANNIPHIQLKIAGGGQRIIVKGRKVQLLNRSIIIYDKASYFAATAREGKSTAIAKHLAIIKHIERLLHVEFLIGNDHKFKVSRQHHALIHNALAKQYNEAGEKLEVRNGRGLWMLIDNSYGMNELEGVHHSTAMTDTKKVQDFFNGLKDIPAQQDGPTYTPSFVLEMMNGIQQNQLLFTENIETHIAAIKDLGSGVSDMNNLLKKIQDIIDQK